MATQTDHKPADPKAAAGTGSGTGTGTGSGTGTASATGTGPTATVPVIGGGTAGDQPSAPGNADDGSETRTPDMGTSPVLPGQNQRQPKAQPAARQPKAQPAATTPAAATVTTLDQRDENAALKARLDELERIVRQGQPAAVAPEPFRTAQPPKAAAKPDDPANGPVLWEGSIPQDRTAPVLRFRAGMSPDAAEKEYLRHCGITGVNADHRVRVARVEG